MANFDTRTGTEDGILKAHAANPDLALNAATPTLKTQLGVSDVTAYHTQLTHIFNPEVVKERNHSYDCHMKNRPPVLAEDRFDPNAVIADRLMVGTAQVIGTHLEGVVVPIGFDTESFYSSVLAAFASAFKVQLAERTAGTSSANGATAAGTSAISSSANGAAAEEQTAAAPANRYERLALAATGAPGLSNRRIAQRKRADVRREGKPFMRFVTGMRIDTGSLAEDGSQISDEGEAAHLAIAAYLRVEAARRTTEATPEERLEALRREKVAHAGRAEAVIGKSGLKNGKGHARRFSRSFIFSLVHSEEFGAILRSIGTDEEEELMTGPIGDEWTFDEVDALLDDERVPLELKALLRLSDAMLVESELKEAELILRYTSRSVRMVKPVGSPCAAVPQRPIIHSWAMSGPASIPTFDAEDAHLTRTGYCHVTSRFPSFDFDICDMAITPAGDWPLLPTSLQSGGDAFILDSNRAGELTAHGFAGRGGGRGRDQVPPLTADEARAAAAEARAAAAAEGLELVPSSRSETGFKGVKLHSGGRFEVFLRENGKQRYISIFATPEEAALCYARSIGAERAAAEAAEARDNGQQPLTADEARAAAAAEGLELVPSSRSETGFKGVVRNSGGRFEVFLRENGKQRYISAFATPEEAALCYARSIGAERAAAEAAEARAAEAAKARAAEAAERKKAAKAKRKAELDARDVPLSRLVEPRTTEPCAAITYAAASIADAIAAAIAHTAPAMPTWQQPTPPAPPPRVLTTAPPVLSATPGAPVEDREEGAEELDEIMDDDIH